MTAKEHLEQYANYKAEKLNLLSERELIIVEEALPPGIDYSADRVQTSPDDGMIKKIERIHKRTVEIDKKIEKLTDQMCRMKAEVNAVEGILSNILWKRYIELKKWEEVAEEMGYSEDHCKGDLHCQALYAFDLVIKNPTKSH